MAAATATADANKIDKSRIIRKPRLRAPRRSSEFGVKLDDIVPGVQLDSPGYLENFVFADNVRTLTW
jgi:hypothetical protein